MPWRRRVALVVLGVGAVASCAQSSSNTPVTDGSDANAADANGASDAAGGDDFPSLNSDGATPDAAGRCSTLNIGILGNPGERPSANFQQWLIASGTTAQRIQTNATPPLTSAVLAPFDVVILDALVRDYQASEVATLEAWVQAGGGVVSMSGYLGEVSDFRANALLAPLGVAYTGTTLDGPVTQFVPHPITAGLTSVTFQGGYLVRDLGGSSTTRTAIASLPQGNVGYAIQAGNGRAFVWGDEWIEFDSEWTTIVQIKQLWVQVFQFLAPSDRCKLQPPK